MLQVLNQLLHLWQSQIRDHSQLVTHLYQIMEANPFYHYNFKWVINRKDLLQFTKIHYQHPLHLAHKIKLFSEIAMRLDLELKTRKERENGVQLKL